MRKLASLSLATALVAAAAATVFAGPAAGAAPAPHTDTLAGNSAGASAPSPQTSQGSQSSQDTVRLVRGFYAAFAKGDITAAQKFVTDDFIMHVPGKGLNAGEYWGKDGLREFMGHILGYNGGTFELKVPHFAVNGDTAFTREVVTLNRKKDPAKLWTLRFTMQYKIKDGRVSEAWTMPEEQDVYDAYWTPSLDSPRGTPASSEPAPALPDGTHALSPRNTRFLNTFYNTFWSGDLDGIRRMVSDQVEVRIPGHSDISGVYKGWDGFLTFRQRVMATVGSRYKLDVSALAGDSTGGFAREFIRMNRPWDPEVKPIEVTMYYTVRHGKIVKMEDIPVDTGAWQDFFTAPHKAA